MRKLISDVVPGLALAQCELRSALIVGQMVGVMTFVSSQRPAHAELDGPRQASVIPNLPAMQMARKDRNDRSDL